MQVRNSSERYGTIARWLHWSMFALIALQLFGGVVLESLPKAFRGVGFDVHETIGIIALLLVLARIAWKLGNPAPVARGRPWQQCAAKVGHLALYGLMIALPVIGYAMVDLKGYDVAFFGWDAPDLLPTNEALAQSLRQVHTVLAWTLAAVVGTHVAAALWHHFGLRDETLRRMLGH